MDVTLGCKNFGGTFSISRFLSDLIWEEPVMPIGTLKNAEEWGKGR